MDLLKLIETLEVDLADLKYEDQRPGFESATAITNNYATLSSAFDAAATNFQVTPRLLKSIIMFSHQLATKNDDHLKFFGGNELGTQRIRFLPSDRDRWFDELLQIDENNLRECCHTVPEINKNWVVTSDVFNLSCIWLIYKINTSALAKDKQAIQAMVEILVILQFRFITSIYSHYFTKPVDEDAAHATYAALTMKFHIKQFGSWGAVLRERATRFLDKDSPHYQTFRKFDTLRVMYVVSDLQTRTRKIIKDMYAVLDEIRASNSRIRSTSASITLDGDKIIKDQVNTYNTARHYLLDVSGNVGSFVKQELIDVVLDLMKTVSEQAFKDMLVVVATAPAGPARNTVEWFLDNTLLHAFDYIARNRIRFTDSGFILVKLRGLYMAPKSPDPLLLELRAKLERFVKQHSKLRSPAALAAARTSLMLYFVLRALSSNQYQ